MKKFRCISLLLMIMPLVLAWPTNEFAAAPSAHYVFTNDDVTSEGNSATFYSVASDGNLTAKKVIRTKWNGIAGGFFAMNRIVALQSGGSNCVYVSDAVTGQIVSIDVSTLNTEGSAKGSKKDLGATNGIGLAVNSNYLYASFSDPDTIGTFQVQPDCRVQFISDVHVGGLNGGVIDGMAIHNDMMVATYGDGSIESFNIANGVPVSNGDEQNSTGSKGGSAYPGGVDITSDGHFAIFGDVATSTIVEVSDISSGQLTKTVVYRLGKGIGSSNILLSPDETLLFISNNQGGTVSAAFFDKANGKLSKGCVSNKLKGYGSWVYSAALALQNTTGIGGMVYVAEYGSPSSIGVIDVQSNRGKCTLKESSNSPVTDRSSAGLLSIGNFPPRPF